MAKQLGHGFLDLALQRIDDRAQAQAFARLPLQRLQVVANRLLSRDGGQRAKDRRDKPHGRGCGRGIAGRVWRGIEIDETPVHLAPGWAAAQRGHGRRERAVDQHGAVDQRGLVHRATPPAIGHDPLQKGRAAPPGFAAFGHQAVNLGNGQRRKRTGKARCGARGQHQFGQRGQAFAGMGAGLGAKADAQAVFVFLYQGRAVEPQRRGMAGKIGGRHHQIDRVARWQQRCGIAAARHRIERLGQQAGKADAAERRGKPACADQARNLAAHFAPGLAVARFLIHLLRQFAARRAKRGPAQHGPDQRLRPELGKAPPWPRIGIEQDVAIGAGQPQPGQRLQALPGGKRLAQEYGVDATGAGAREDIDQHAQAQPALGVDGFQQGDPHCFDPRLWHRGCGRPGLGVDRATGPRQVPQFLGNPMHIHRQADAAGGNKGQAQFFLPHGQTMAGIEALDQ